MSSVVFVNDNDNENAFMCMCMYVRKFIAYPAHLKQKSYSRAAVSNKQKRLQCPFGPFSRQVG